ncbi:MAG: hypothetical protein AAGB48_01955 [Planctomycetota bacterium]
MNSDSLSDDSRVGEFDLAKRGDRTLLYSALCNGYELPEHFYREAPRVLWSLVERISKQDNPKDRDIARIMALLMKMDDSNASKAKHDEEQRRLNSGSPTENIQITVNRTDQLRKPDD